MVGCVYDLPYDKSPDAGHTCSDTRAFGKYVARSFISVTEKKTIIVWYHFKHISVPFVMTQISCEYCDADTKYTIMKTCTVCTLEKAKCP